MEANTTIHEAFVSVHERPGCLVVLPANSAGQVRTGGRLVDGLLEVHQLAGDACASGSALAATMERSRPTRRSINPAGRCHRYLLVRVEAKNLPATYITHWVARTAAAEVDSPQRSAVPN